MMQMYCFGLPREKKVRKSLGLKRDTFLPKRFLVQPQSQPSRYLPVQGGTTASGRDRVVNLLESRYYLVVVWAAFQQV